MEFVTSRLIFLLLVSAISINGSESSKLLKRQKRIVGGIQAAQPPEDDPVVFVNKNERDARILGTRDPKKGFYVFRGIRFGEAPLGRHRFQRPKAAFLEGEFNATAWGPPCPQPLKDGKVIGTEDCLFLNVFTPTLPDAGDGYPVLIWIHGGGFRRGAACQYEMRNLIKKKMIVVSIQYRLGSLGFLSTGTKELPGNNGMFDMALAVKWVKDYIEFFGGDPKKIIAFGHGSGASSAFMLAMSKITKSFFSGLIAMSGSILSHFALDKDPMKTARTIASRNDCPIDDVPRMIQCLQELPMEKIVQSDSVLESIRMTAQGFISQVSDLLSAGPVIEGEDDQRSLPNFLTETPENNFKLGNFPNIPLLTGVVKDETGGAVSGLYKNEVADKLKTIPDFLNNNLIKNLHGTVANLENATKKFIPEVFSNYVNVFNKNKSGEGVGKVAEVMGDALFNAPAFLTIDHWSKKAKAFLYSFDHKGKRCFGKDFLGGLPIVDAKTSCADGTNHGDDLGYIFDRNSIFGEEILDGNDQNDADDEHVTDVFTDMIANFARKGEVSVPTSSKDNILANVVPSFSDNNPFISITSTPQLMKNFRYCEMALWTGMTERLQSSTCNILKSTFKTAEKVGEETRKIVEKPIGSVQKGIQNVASLGVGTANELIVPSNDNQQKNTQDEKRKENKLPKFRVPFNIG